MPDALRPYWQAFQRLSAERSYIGGGMGGAVPQPIKYTAVCDYTERRGYAATVAEWEWWDAMLRQLDDVYLADAAERAK